MAPDGFTLASRRSRASSLGLSLGVVALILLALLTMAPPREPREKENRLSTFAVSPAASPARRSAANRSRQRTPRRAPAAAAAPHVAVTRPPVPTKAKAVALTGVIPMDLASTDVGAIKGTATAGTGDAAGTGDSKAAYGPGAGPGGEALYDAEWYRPPTDAEINGYLPPRPVPPGSWADIACRMIEDYHVENCRALGESPMGSGLARAMRQAAWQFRVRPPRVGGKAQLGTWVRIHISWDGAGVR